MNEGNLKSKYKPASIKDLMRYATTLDWVLLILALIFGSLNGIIWPFVLVVNLKLVGSLLDAQAEYETGQIDMDKFTNGMTEACLWYFVIACAIFVAGFIGVFLITIVSQRQIRIIQQKFLIHILNQDMTWLDEHQIGALTEKVSAYMDRIKEGTSDKVIVLLQGFFNLVFGTIVGFFMNWKLASVTFLSVPLIILSLYASTRVSDKMIRKERKAFSNASSIAEQALHGIYTVLAFNSQPFELANYVKNLDEACRLGTQKSILTSGMMGLYKLFLFSTMGLSFWYGTKLVLDDEISAPVVMAVFWAISVGAIRIGFAMPHVGSIISARLAAGEVFSIIDRRPELDSSSLEGERPEKIDGNIEFQDVNFNYSSRPKTKILNKVTFKVMAGQKIALVGHSGCGKSTIVSLLMRFYNPDSGTIKLDGRPIDKLNVEWLRNAIGIVSQEPVIFTGTITDNLRMGKNDLSQVEMENACRIANAEEFIKKLPKSYNTLIGDGNIILSGGQKQRLAIARALVKSPKILILDEATSSLDNESERLVQQGLDQASANRTCITIAHRLSTIKNSDKIFVFENGEIKESGSHEELMRLDNREGVYRNLVMAQAIDYMDEDKKESGFLKNGISDVYRQSIEKPIFRRGWQQESDTHLFTLSLLKNTKDTTDLDGELANLKVKPSSLLQIYRFAREEHIYIWLGVISAILLGLAWPCYTVFYGLLFRTLAGSLDSDRKKLLQSENLRNGLLYLSLGIFACLFQLLAGSLFGYIGQVVTKKMRIEVFKNILRQDGSFFDQPEHARGKLLTRLVSDAPNVQAAIDERFAEIFQACWTMIFGILMAFYFDWKMALIEIVIVGSICLIQIIFLEALKRRKMRDAQLGEEAIRIANEAISNVKTVQALNRQRHFYQQFKLASKKPYNRAMWSAPLQAAVFGVGSCSEELNFVFTYLAGLLMIRAGHASPFIVFQVIENINIGLIICGIFLALYIPSYTQALASAGLMFKMMKETAMINSMGDKGKNSQIEGQIQLENVEFAYPRAPDRKVLRGLSFQAEKAKSLALVGPSGCGKSTIMALLERYYDVQSGQICVDNVNVKEMNIRNLRNNMSVVSQEPNLFNLTIRENIAYGIDKVDQSSVIEAAKLANIHNFIITLPKGYETMIGSRGMQVSGGQRQRLSIARAIYRKPKILLFDEATSCLDTASEKLVQESIERAAQGRCCITIAHRLSTIQDSDLIVFIKEGRVLEQGTHSELMSQKGAYYRLVQKQNH